MFIPCYDIINKEIYFFNFFTEEIIDLNSLNKSENDELNNNNNNNKVYSINNILNKEELKQYNESLNKFKLNWYKMKLISKFNSITSLPGEAINFFKRPFYSHYLLAQNLKLYSFNSCIQTPNVLTTYQMKIEIQFDKETILNKISHNNKILPYSTTILLITVVDSLIKSTVDYLLNSIKIEDENNINNSSDFYDLINDKSNVFVLKFKENEEYLYGDYLIGSYEFVRGLVRQNETVYFYLKLMPLFIVEPPLLSFPPIITMSNLDEINYINLIKKYLLYYPNFEIIYRIYKPGVKEIKRFKKQKYKRHEKLNMYSESGDCYFPLWIKIVRINNIFKLKEWFDDENYNKNEMMIPTFKYYPKKKPKQKKCFCFNLTQNNNNNYNYNNWSKNKKKNNNSNKQKEKENKKIQNLMNNMGKKYKKDSDLQKKLNNLKIEINYPPFYDYSINVLTKFNTIFGEEVLKTIEFLSTEEKNVLFRDKIQTENESINNYNNNNNNNNNEIYDESDSELEPINLDPKKINSKYKIFSVNNYVLPFNPAFIRIRINLLYGSYSLLNFKSDPYLFSDNILINEKFYFDNKKCLISNLPFETRIGLTLEAFDSRLKKYYVLGSCQIPLYKSNGQMQKETVTMNLWPKANINPRFNNCSSFNLVRKNFIDENNVYNNKINNNINEIFNLRRIKLFNNSSIKELLPKDSYPLEAQEYLPEILNKIDYDFKDIIKLHTYESNKKNKKKSLDELIRKYKKKVQIKKDELKTKIKSRDDNNIVTTNNNINNIDLISNKSKDLSSRELIDTKFNKILINNSIKNKENINSTNENNKKDIFSFFKKNNSKKKSDNNNKDKNNENNENNINNNKTNKEDENINDSFIINDNNNNIPNNINNNNNEYNDLDNRYCSITIGFPKFASPLLYSQNSSQSYRDYLQIKYKNEKQNNSIDDFIEIRKLYGNSQKDISFVVDDFNKNFFISEETNLNNTSNIKESLNFNDKYPKNIWVYVKKTLPLILQILKKDPLEALTEDEITAILICRDYITSIPSALELFLRAIDWLNPLQVSIAHLYIKKWAKLKVEDAISLLDARFPDTETRKFAVSILREQPDDLINMYMLQLCQCLLYETFLINPLSDFLIERSLINPKLIGKSFFWNSRVSMKNPLFADRLTLYLIQMLMLSGEKFLNDLFNGIYLNNYLEFMTYYVKIANNEKKEKPKKAVQTFLKFFKNKLKIKNFTLPIDPTYFGTEFDVEEFTIFSSKMLPVLLKLISREGDKKNVIFKIGDDLRQDVLTLQIFKIMDKLWLDNNLDLKVIPYKVCPTELKAGFIECLTGIELDKLQMSQGLTGSLNRELIVEFLRKKNSKNKKDISKQSKFDNFIKSLAGYCVATCVIGVGDRHPGNIMIKHNGIFFHIDFGHILGNFKSKFFIKRERSPFLLTPEMANVYITENKEEYFKTACVKAFKILRDNAQRLINMFIIMSTAGMPELCGMNDVKYMKKMLVLDKQSDEDAGNYFIGLIKQSKNDRFRLIDNMIHNWKH